MWLHVLRIDVAHQFGGEPLRLDEVSLEQAVNPLSVSLVERATYFDGSINRENV